MAGEPLEGNVGSGRNIVLAGAPGSGKGTQAQRLFNAFGVPQVSTGDMLRAARRAGSELGRKAAEYMDAGLLVPDRLILELIEERLRLGDVQDGFVLDGFPRTGAQASALDRMLAAYDAALSAVVVIDVSEDLLVERIAGRLTCPACGSMHHRTFAKPKVAGQCDACGHAGLAQREDDKEEKVRVRLEAYRSVQEEVIPHYEELGLVSWVDGARSADHVFVDVRRLLEALPKW